MDDSFHNGWLDDSLDDLSYKLGARKFWYRGRVKGRLDEEGAKVWTKSPLKKHIVIKEQVSEKERLTYRKIQAKSKKSQKHLIQRQERLLDEAD